MNVVRHQHISVNVGFVRRCRCTEDSQKTLVVRRCAKNVNAVDTSLNDVVRSPWDLQAVSARHVARTAQTVADAQRRFSA